MFTQESEWSNAYDAAEAVLNTAISRGDLAVEAGRPWTATVRQIAVQVAGAVIRAGGEQPEGDISDTVPIETDKAFNHDPQPDGFLFTQNVEDYFSYYTT